MISRIGSKGIGILSIAIWICLSAAAPLSAASPSLSDILLPPTKPKIPPAKPWGRDPFMGEGTSLSGNEGQKETGPSDGSGKAGGTLSLMGIITRGGEGLAIINNEILRKGDHVQGKELVEIHRDHVVLQAAKGKTELRVNPFTVNSNAVDSAPKKTGNDAEQILRDVKQGLSK